MFLSVIIPIYNKEKYLERCISVILRQIDSNVEIILIDDGSTDGSSEICDIYAKLDKRICVLHKDNGGVSSAGNLGLSIAKGRYIAFCDADDFYSDNFYTQITRIINIHQPDVIEFAHTRIENGNKILKVYNRKDGFWDKTDYLYQLADDLEVRSYICTRVFKRSLFHDIIFPIGIKLMEDYAIMHKLIWKAKTLYYTSEPLYNYYITGSGACNQQDFNVRFKCIEIAKKRYKYLLEKGLNVSKRCFLLHEMKLAIFLAHNGSKEDISFYKCVNKDIRDNMSDILRDSTLSLKTKIKFLLIATRTIGLAFNIRNKCNYILDRTITCYENNIGGVIHQDRFNSLRTFNIVYCMGEATC